MFRNICEAYFCTIADLEDMTLDQLYIMAVEKKLLGGANLITGTPEELYAKGLLKNRPYPDGLSLVERMKRNAEQDHSGKSKRQRRAERRAKMVAEMEE